jgi:alkylated DNA nucleotide flippase Atl1
VRDPAVTDVVGSPAHARGVATALLSGRSRRSDPPATEFETIADRSGWPVPALGILRTVPLFEVDPHARSVARVDPATFPDLGLWERQDLEAWVASAPEVAGGDFSVLTSEFDRFDRTNERLDVLGITATDEGARLVVVELKRDGSSTTVDLQAIKYAAYVAAAKWPDVVEMYARHHNLTEGDAQRALLDLVGGTEDVPPEIDSTPRIVLVASDFRTEVTTTVLWLIDNFEMDIRCVRLQPFRLGERTLVHSEVIIPLPEAEQYRLGVQRKRREAERGGDATRAGRLVPRLLDAGALEVGQILHFRQDAVATGTGPAWSATEPLYTAKLATGEGVKTLEWTDPESGQTTLESPSLLAATLLRRLGLREGPVTSAGVNGMHYWTVDGHTSLRDLGAEAGVLERTGRSINRERLYAVCADIPAGNWISYKDLAQAIGVPGAQQSVAGVVASDPHVPNAHRVLRQNGRISPSFITHDGSGGPEVARQRLEQEGVSFGQGDAADPGCRWTDVPSDY